MWNILSDYHAALTAKEYILAENIALNQLNKLGENALWLNELGLLHLLQKQLSKALNYFERVLVIDKFNIEAELNIAIILSDLGFYDEALQHYQEAESHENVFLAKKHHDMALFYQSMKNIPEAVFEVKKAIQLYENSEYHSLLENLSTEAKN